MKLWLADEPLVISDAQGMYLIDSDGNRYLDGVSSLWCNVHGHRVPEIDRAIREQLERVAHSTMLGLANEPAILLADRLMKIVPGGLDKIFYSDSGRRRRKLRSRWRCNIGITGKGQKCEFISFAEAYHGDTVGAISIGRMEVFHRAFFPLMFRFTCEPVRVSQHDAGSMGSVGETAVEKRWRRSNMAGDGGGLFEPVVQGAAGMTIDQPRGFWGVAEISDRYEVLLIADEVAVGFGRTGKMFACEHEEVGPDLMCVAKGMTEGICRWRRRWRRRRYSMRFWGSRVRGRRFFMGIRLRAIRWRVRRRWRRLNCSRRRFAGECAEKSIELAECLSAGGVTPSGKSVRRDSWWASNWSKKGGGQRLIRTADGGGVCSKSARRGVILRPLGDVVGGDAAAGDGGEGSGENC